MSFLKSKTLSGRSVGGRPDGLIIYWGFGTIGAVWAGVGIWWGSASISGVIGIGRVKVRGGVGITGLGVGVGAGTVAGVGAGGTVIGLGGRGLGGIDGGGGSTLLTAGGAFLKSTISGTEDAGSRYLSTTSLFSPPW